MTSVAAVDRGESRTVARSPSVEHVLRELERIDVLIRHEVARARTLLDGSDELRGLYIDEAEVDALMTKPLGAPGWLEAHRLHPDVTAALQAMAAHTADWKRSIRAAGPLRLDELRRLYALTDFDVDVLVTCMAPALDLGYERLFAYLQDDVTKRRPTMSLVLDLLCADLDERLDAMTRLTMSAPLLRHRLVAFPDEPAAAASPLARPLQVDERIVSYLLGSDLIDRRLATAARLEDPSVALGDLVLPDGVARLLRSIAHRDPEESTVVLLHGPYGVGRHSAAAAVAALREAPLLTIDLAARPDRDDDFDAVVAIACREADLQGAVLLWLDCDTLLAGEARRRTLFIRALEEHRGLSFLSATTAWEPADALDDGRFLRVELSPPSYGERIRLWEAELGRAGLDADVDVTLLAQSFRFTAGRIKDVVATGASLAERADPADPAVSTADLMSAARLQSNLGLGGLARHIVPSHDWNDLVLPPDRLEALHDMARYVRHHARVFDDWDFRSKLSLGRGLTALFVGASGTGKTMAAEVLAGDLGKALYKIDISAMVSKYIGETEKNLARVFAEAESSNALLFFDEADALFGKRTEVRDAHDRYANVGTAFLLQRIEEYDGIVILATNLQKNMDDAFVRRLRYIVEFPSPTAGDRLRIWRNVFPNALPMGADVDLEFMADTLEFTGGNIRNVAVAAAFLAAGEETALGMRHLVHAAKREYQKMGKVLTGGEFGPYAALLAVRPGEGGG